jgi:predicted DNA binding CopG/RHH family protein
MSEQRKLEPFPRFENDADAERFVAEADLSGYDFSGFRPMSFEFERKTEQVNLRMSASLLERIKKRANERGIPYQRYMREILEKSL